MRCCCLRRALCFGVRGALDDTRDPEFLRATSVAWSLLGAAGAFDFARIPAKGHEFFVAETSKFFQRTFAAGPPLDKP